MAKVYEFEGLKPVIDIKAFVHPDAVVIGDVIIKADCYIGPCACLRGDFGRIRVERGVNIQDTCVIHTFPEEEVILEENAHIGHGAVLHGCVVKKNSLVGMRSVIMDGSRIGENSFVAAMSFVKSNFLVPDNVLVAGIPAKVVKELHQNDIVNKSKATYLYQQLAVRSINSMKGAKPLTKVEQNRNRIHP